MKTKPVILTLPDYAREGWERELATYKVNLANDSDLREGLVKARQMANAHLPDDIQLTLYDLLTGRINPPYVLLKNTPIDDVSNTVTPTDGYLSREKKTMIAEGCQLGVAQLVGILFSFLKERQNAGLMHIIAGRPGQEHARTSESSSAFLGSHVEHAWSTNLCPSFVVLQCLRQDPDRQAITGIFDLRDLIPLLSNEDLAILQKPIFAFRLPDSLGATSTVTQPMPIISGSISDPQWRFTLEGKMLVVSAQPAEVAAGYAAIDKLVKLMSAHEELSHGVTLEAGDLLFINNRTCVHSRSSFTVWAHGFNRWLHRVLVIPSLYEARTMKTDRLCQFA